MINLLYKPISISKNNPSSHSLQPANRYYLTFSIKPAIFDFFLSIAIVLYLGCLYLFLTVSVHGSNENYSISLIFM